MNAQEMFCLPMAVVITGMLIGGSILLKMLNSRVDQHETVCSKRMDMLEDALVRLATKVIDPDSVKIDKHL